MACPNCFMGGVTKNHPKGTETTIHGLPTYVAQPDEGVTPKAIIVFLTDAFGWKFPNNRVLCDHYAKIGGFLVYCPDFMFGYALDPIAMTYVDKFMAPTSWLETIFYKPIWLIKALRIALPWKFKTEIPATHPGVLSFFQTLRTSEPPFATDNLKIGAAGFCWGGKHAFILAQDKPETQVVRHESQIEHTKDMRLLDCAFTAHPSYINPPDDVISVTIPMSVSVGDVDMALKEAKAIEMKKILEAVDGNMHEVIILSGAKHGFAVRSRPDDKHEMEMAAKAEVQAIEWFRRWLV